MEQFPLESKPRFEELDSWWLYVDDYDATMQMWTYILSFAIVALLPLAIFVLHFPRAVNYGLAIAGAAGGCVSVVAKLPPLSLSSEFEVYLRRILSRIATGAAASLIGCALLAWGLVPISIQNQTFADLLSACEVPTNASCTEVKILILSGIPMLFGFSERALMSFEERIFGDSRGTRPRKFNDREDGTDGFGKGTE